MSTFHSQPEPPVLLICHMCRLVHDERKAVNGWLTKEAYRKATGIDPITCRLTHTYCPTCYASLVSRAPAA